MSIIGCMCFFFNDTATTEIYTFPYTTLFRSMSTLRIGSGVQAIVMPVVVLDVLGEGPAVVGLAWGLAAVGGFVAADRKSTRLNSSHANISYAVFCLTKTIEKLPHPLHDTQ